MQFLFLIYVISVVELNSGLCCRCFARPAGDSIYEVRQINQSGEKYTVNMNEGCCSCRRWMLTGIPCCHAVTCCNEKKIDPEQLIPEYYRKEAYINCYQPIIFPTNGPNLWEETPYPDILPPPMRRAPGRPKKSRRKDADEKVRDSTQLRRKGMAGKCSRCKQGGHNKSSCPLPAPPSTATTEASQTTGTPSSAAETEASQTNAPKKKGRPKKTHPIPPSSTPAVAHPITPVAPSNTPAAAHQTAATQPRRSPRGLSKRLGNVATQPLRMKLPTRRAP